MKSGDIVIIYADPINLEKPVGQAKLIKEIEDFGDAATWEVEYVDDLEHIYVVLIKRV